MHILCRQSPHPSPKVSMWVPRPIGPMGPTGSGPDWANGPVIQVHPPPPTKIANMAMLGLWASFWCPTLRPLDDFSENKGPIDETSPTTTVSMVMLTLVVSFG